MKETIERQTDNIGVERGRSLVLSAFSTDYQRMRNPGTEQLMCATRTTEQKMKVVKENGEEEIVSAGGFNPMRCHAPSQKRTTYSKPLLSDKKNTGIESSGIIIREIRALKSIYQVWLRFQYGRVKSQDVFDEMHRRLATIYRGQHISRPINHQTLIVVDGMILSHLYYLERMDKPLDRVPNRKDANSAIGIIPDRAWSRTYRTHWRDTWMMIKGIDHDALNLVDQAIS